MHIGLIGGIGPAATDYYYRRLIAAFARANAALELTIVHADSPTLLGNLAAGNTDAQVAIYNHLTERLVSAGADCVVVTSVAGHFCISQFETNARLEVINLLVAVDAAIKHRNLSRVGILGTRTVMQSKFYAGVSTADVIVLPDSMLESVHEAYVSMATTGQVTEAQRAVFDSACNWYLDEAEVDAIMMGGTDLALVYQEGETQIPIIDCAAIHIEAIVERSLKSQ